MTDAWAVAVAVAAVVGAWTALPVPLLVGGPVVALALALRRPAALALGVALVAGGCSARAWAGTSPVPASSVAGRVTLVSDPERRAGGVRAIVRLDGDRLEAWARGGAARRLERRSAGEVVEVVGRVAPLTGSTARRLAVRHVRGRLTVERVGADGPGGALTRSATRARDLVARGGRTLPPAERALYTGMVLGDDRAMAPETVDAFRAAGLSHLTAVSGQNVAFVLAVAGPLLRRLRPWPRWLATLALLGWFVVLTRAEPSVLRAGAMAALAATAFVFGRPASTVRLLALAVAGLVVVDPLLVWSVGFWLSVGATGGIALLAGPLADALPVPRPLALALGVTMGAQVGVAPVSTLVFGSLPLAALPANLLAGPAAAPVTVWGLPAGLVATWLPDPLAWLVQLPTFVCLRWIGLVADGAARARLPAVGPAPALVLAAVVVGVVWWHRTRSSSEPLPGGGSGGQR